MNMVYPENIEEIKKFAEGICIDVKYLLGKRYGCSLYLTSVKSLPDNIVFDVGGSLYLSSVVSLPDNIVFDVGGSLYLPSVESLPSNTIFNINEKIYFPIDHKVKVIWN